MSSPTKIVFLILLLAACAAQAAPPPLPGAPAGRASDSARHEPAGLGPAGSDWQSQDYDDLYALLQKYRDELKAMSGDKSKYEQQTEEMRARIRQLEEKLANLKPLDGMKIHGRILTYFNDFNSFGPGARALERGHFRHAVQRAELELSYTRSLLRGLVQYDFQYVFGNQYDGFDLLGIQKIPAQSGMSQGGRQIWVELLTPLRVRVGTLDYRLTPFTFWRNEDPDPYVPEPFASRRQRLRDDLLLKDDHSHLLRGLRLSYGKDWGFSALLSQIATASDAANASGNRVYQGAGAPPVDLFEPFNTYVGAWRLHAGAAGMIRASLQGHYVGDSPDSGGATYAVGAHPDPARTGRGIEGFAGMVNSASLHLSPTAWLDFEGEYAMSSLRAPSVAAIYLDPAAGPDSTLNGSAMRAGASMRMSALTLKARFVQVSRGFNSSPAQGRTWDAALSPMGPLETENSRFDPMSGGFGDIRVPRPPQTIYNRSLLPPVAYYRAGIGPTIAALSQIPSEPGVNTLDPYGLATPNRQRFGGSLDLDFWDGRVGLGGDFDSAAQAEGEGGRPVESYTRLLGGARLKLGRLSFKGSYELAGVKNEAWVQFSSARVQGGVEFELWKGGLLQAGARHLDFNGVLAYADPTPFAPADPALLAFGRRALDKVYEQWAVGMVQSFGEDLVLSLNYGALDFTNGLAGKTAAVEDSRPGFRVEEGYLRLSLSF